MSMHCCMVFRLYGKQTTDFLERLFRARKAGGVEGEGTSHVAVW